MEFLNRFLGYDKYPRLKFLNIDSMASVWQKLSVNKELDVFKETYIPFTIDNENPMVDIRDLEED